MPSCSCPKQLLPLLSSTSFSLLKLKLDNKKTKAKVCATKKSVLRKSKNHSRIAKPLLYFRRRGGRRPFAHNFQNHILVLGAVVMYTSDAADDLLCVDLGGRRIIKK